MALPRDMDLELFLEQQDHERMKEFMRDKDWSILVTLDPAEIYELLQMEGAEDIDSLIDIIINKE